jgi:4-diphosphocytidyl-2-C-methyl-D-erythritol kinase
MPPLRLRVSAFAKINLSLRVVGTRPDGFHDLQTIFQSLALHDTLIFTATPGPFAIACTDAAVPTGEENLVWRAAARLWTALGRSGSPRDVQIAIRKRIPVQAGLGGGSADAAAALVGLARLWCRSGPRPDLHELSAAIGADAAYFLVGGTAMGLGRGEDLYPLEDIVPMQVVLALPDFGVSTSEAYRWFDAATSAQAPPRRTWADHLAAWAHRDLVIQNDLTAPVVQRHPEIRELQSLLRRFGAAAALMTGSGSAVFGLFDQAPRSAQAAIGVSNAGWRVLLTETLGRAEYARRHRPALLR